MPARRLLLRSASKPIQALPLVRARDDLDDRDIAIASASHRATDDQIAAVRALLAKAPATEDELELGPQGGRPAAEDLQQLLRQARRDARPLPRARLGRRRATASPATPCSRPASPRTPRPPRSTPTSSRRRSTAAASSRSRSRSSAWRFAFSRFETLPGGAPRRRRDARAPRPRRRPRRRRLPSSCAQPPAGSRRAAPRACSAPAARRHRHRAQVRGRRDPAARPGARRVPGTLRRRLARASRSVPIVNTGASGSANAVADFVTCELFFTNL